VDTYLAIASKREDRSYDERPIPPDVQRRILEAGRVAGSAANRQPWRFYVLEDRGTLERVAETVYVPGNLLGAKLVVLITLSGRGAATFDAGRAAQNMMLAAWNEGVGSCPNGMTDAEKTADVLGIGADEQPMIVLSFGYPARPRDPSARSAEEWIARANRKPFEEVTRRL
jgi:nitroreductase